MIEFYTCTPGGPIYVVNYYFRFYRYLAASSGTHSYIIYEGTTSLNYCLEIIARSQGNHDQIRLRVKKINGRLISSGYVNLTKDRTSRWSYNSSILEDFRFERAVRDKNYTFLCNGFAYKRFQRETFWKREVLCKFSWRCVHIGINI